MVQEQNWEKSVELPLILTSVTIEQAELSSRLCPFMPERVSEAWIR